MANAVTQQLPHNLVHYQTTFHIPGEKDLVRTYVRNEQKGKGFIGTCVKINTSAKGVADSFALIGRSCKLATSYLPVGVSSWTENVSNFTLKARSVMAIPFLWTALDRFQKEITFRSTCELAATGFHAVALFIMHAVSKAISSVGTFFKALVDSSDCYTNANKFLETRKLCEITVESAEVKSGLDSDWYKQLFNVGKFALAAIAGFAATFVFVTGVALPAGIAIGVLVGSVASAIFSVISDYALYAADYVEPRI